MNKQEALLTFAPYLANECSECKAPPGELCDSVSVWIHLDRLLLLEKNRQVETLDREKPPAPPKGIPWGEDLSRDCEEMRRLEQWGIFPEGYHSQNCSIH